MTKDDEDVCGGEREREQGEKRSVFVQMQIDGWMDEWMDG